MATQAAIHLCNSRHGDCQATLGPGHQVGDWAWAVYAAAAAAAAAAGAGAARLPVGSIQQQVGCSLVAKLMLPVVRQVAVGLQWHSQTTLHQLCRAKSVLLWSEHVISLSGRHVCVRY
jgi:DNA-binding transcriptional LysR family regulator